MKYALLIYTNPLERASMTPADYQQEMEAYTAFSKEVYEAGIYKVGEALYATDRATTVQVDAGKPIISDGPFAETREILGGFYILKLDNLDDAIQWAAKIPVGKEGKVEIRPVVEFD